VTAISRHHPGAGVAARLCLGGAHGSDAHHDRNVPDHGHDDAPRARLRADGRRACRETRSDRRDFVGGTAHAGSALKTGAFRETLEVAIGCIPLLTLGVAAEGRAGIDRVVCEEQPQTGDPGSPNVRRGRGGLIAAATEGDGDQRHSCPVNELV
jgi:hypothetical protein